ncbi:unnamed protein product [Brassica oleracea]|uniref:(rape) hypothetical protein n=1 Tax=Brassica napus TaxID=3708 RepID=A0A816LIA3_BRANA|nr:unnamed protein product [Brassica napus]
MAGDVSKRKEAPTVKLNKLRMEEMMSEIMRRMKKSDLLQKKHADDFFGNVSQVQKDANIKRSKIPSFSGKNDHDGYLEWEQKMELVFDGQNYSERKKAEDNQDRQKRRQNLAMIIITQENLSHISKEGQTHVLSQESVSHCVLRRNQLSKS